jgi:hypothetical protein
MYNHPASSVSATMAVAMATIRLVSIVATLGFSVESPQVSPLSNQSSMHASGSAPARSGGKLNRDFC